MKTCLYHKNCMDGFGAAYAVWKADPNYNFVAMQYGDELPNLDDCEELLMVDFSLPLAKIEELMNKMRVIIIDHHKTAEENLTPIIQNSKLLEKYNSYVLFDMNKSGAILTWEYFHSLVDQNGTVFNTLASMNPPLLLKYIQDRDLWRWELEESEAVSSYLSCYIDFYKTSFTEFNSLVKRFESNSQTFINAGRPMIDYRNQLVESICKNHHIIDFECPDGKSFKVPIVNSCIFQSEIGNKLSKNYSFAIVCFYDFSKGKLIHSLRSNSNGEDVSKICAQFGGGGHKHAGGFTKDLTFS